MLRTWCGQRSAGLNSDASAEIVAQSGSTASVQKMEIGARLLTFPSLMLIRNLYTLECRNCGANWDVEWCLAGSGAVTLGDGSTCSVDDVVSGMAVAVPGGVALVLCVLRMRRRTGRALLVELDTGLKITPCHPDAGTVLGFCPGSLDRSEMRSALSCTTSCCPVGTS